MPKLGVFVLVCLHNLNADIWKPDSASAFQRLNEVKDRTDHEPQRVQTY